ncbi:MAG: YlmH/Sll1252 family protein [Bacilli bacterium]|nr:YlmH/Sll1252 family protein [Bacilli bacterium]
MENIKIENIVRNAHSKPYLTKFLTIKEQIELEKLSKQFKVSFSNSYPDEERKRAFLSEKDMNITPDFKIAYLKIISKQKLAHSDILGAVLSLGIDREVIGDILIDEQIIICTEEISLFLINNLNKIKRSIVQLEKVTNFNFSWNNNYEEKQIILTSLRLDAIIAKSINVSRAKAQELINNRLIMVNGNTEIKCDLFCIESDIVSIRRFGRIKILDVTRKTKKDKLVLNILLTKIKK